MSIGIIAEFNPFHNGHLYFINKIREKYPNDILICVMPSSFSQRGDSLIINKFKRSDIALKYGIDIVVELPFTFATSSSDFFAYGSITLLNYLKVDKIIFGSESNNLEQLEEIVNCQLNNNLFDNLVKLYCKQGNNYPTSLALAINEIKGIKIDTPNDLLGISYLKTIKKYNYNIKVETIKRDNNYNSNELESDISSGLSIRNAIKNNKDICNTIPSYVVDKLDKLHFIDDYYDLLKYRILTTDSLTDIFEVNKGIENKIRDNINKCSCFNELILKLKSKNLTYNKISRILVHILCDYTNSRHDRFSNINYIRLLKINNRGRLYLNSIKKSIDIPIISRLNRNIPDDLKYEIVVSNIYDIVIKENMNDLEYKNKIYEEDL